LHEVSSCSSAARNPRLGPLQSTFPLICTRRLKMDACEAGSWVGSCAVAGLRATSQCGRLPARGVTSSTSTRAEQFGRQQRGADRCRMASGVNMAELGAVVKEGGGRGLCAQPIESLSTVVAVHHSQPDSPAVIQTTLLQATSPKISHTLKDARFEPCESSNTSQRLCYQHERELLVCFCFSPIIQSSG